MLVESDASAYLLWRAGAEAVTTDPLTPRPVREDTAVAFLSVQDAGDVLFRVRVPIPWDWPSEDQFAPPRSVHAAVPVACGLLAGWWWRPAGT